MVRVAGAGPGTLSNVVAQIEAVNGKGLAVQCDLTKPEQVGEAVRKIVAAYGRVDVLVNNGGGQFFSPAEAISDKGWDAVVATNLTGTWNLTRAVADQAMLKAGGRIVNVTMLTRNAFPGMTHSVAARAGVEAMTRTLAVNTATLSSSG